MAAVGNSDTIRMMLHPDALFDEGYQEPELDLSSYFSFDGVPELGDVSGQGVEVRCGSGTMRVEACTTDILRIRAVPAGNDFGKTVTESLDLVRVPGEKVAVAAEAHDNLLEIGGGNLVCRIDPVSRDFAVLDTDDQLMLESIGGGIRLSSEDPEHSGTRSFCRFRLLDERILGFGGRIMNPDRTGMFADMFAVKAGRHSGDYGGFPVPFFLSTAGYGLFFNNPWPHVYFDLGRMNPEEWFVHAPGGDCDLFIIRGPEFPDIINRFTELVGRIPAPRRWWLGLWAGSLSIARTSEVLDAARKFRELNCPVECFQIDGNWRGGPDFLESYMTEGAYTSNDFEWHPEFGDGPAMVEKLRSMNMKTVLHINSRCYREDTTERGIKEGWIRREGHETVARVGDPEAEKHYQALLAGRNADGIGAWLQDHGDRVSGEVLPGIPSRNLFGALWARATTATCTGKDPDPIVFTRGCCIGGQRHSIVWSGDTRFGVDFFEEDIWFMLNAGLAGFPLSSCDLGGFYWPDPFASPYDRAFDIDNLTRRLCQCLFFMPTPRLQDGGGQPAKFPWNCPKDIQKLYIEMLNVRYRLIPYMFSYAVQASQTGAPILRPLVYHYRDDRTVYDMFDEFMMGEWLLVAPVTRRQQFSRAVYLPKGKWVNFWNDDVIRGGRTVRVKTPLLEVAGLPVFVKAGAILPSQEPVDHLEDGPPAVLTLDIYPDGESEFVLHEEDGLRTRLACREGKDVIDVDIEAHEGRERTFIVRVHDVKQRPVIANGGMGNPGPDGAIEVKA